MREYRHILLLLAFVVAAGALTVNSAETERDAAPARKKAAKAATVTVVKPDSVAATVTTPTVAATAETATSPAAGEQINWSVLGAGGALGSSTNWIVAGTVGQSAVGPGSSANYAVNHGFWQNFATSGNCCVGIVGNVNDDAGNLLTIGDVAMLIDAKFIDLSCSGLPCLAEADLNQSGGATPDCDDLTIGDIALLIDYLFITGPTLPLPSCL